MKKHRFAAALIAAGIAFPLLIWANQSLFPDDTWLEIDLKIMVGFGLLCILIGLGLILFDAHKRKSQRP